VMLGDLDKITRVKTAESLILEMLENGILEFLITSYLHENNKRLDLQQITLELYCVFC
jgi:hypothetical protein